MKNIILISLLIAIFLQSCSPKIRTNLSPQTFNSLATETEILVLNNKDVIPEDSKPVGYIKISDSGFSTDCDYEEVINNAKEIARKSGANLILLTEIKRPSSLSSCYRIKAKLYRNLNPKDLTSLAVKINLANKSRLPADADYAMVYFYRPPAYSGSAIGFKIRLDDETIIGRVRNGEKFAYKITDFGEHQFWGRTETESVVNINVEKGQEYFVRCGITYGVVVGRPAITIIENQVGITEYEEME